MKQSHTRTRPGNSPSESTNQQVHIADTKQTGHNILFLNLKNKNMLQKRQNKTMKTKTMSLLMLVMFGFLTLFMIGCQKDDDVVIPQQELSQKQGLEDISYINKDMYDIHQIIASVYTVRTQLESDWKQRSQYQLDRQLFDNDYIYRYMTLYLYETVRYLSPSEQEYTKSGPAVESIKIDESNVKQFGELLLVPVIVDARDYVPTGIDLKDWDDEDNIYEQFFVLKKFNNNYIIVNFISGYVSDKEKEIYPKVSIFTQQNWEKSIYSKEGRDFLKQNNFSDGIIDEYVEFLQSNEMKDNYVSRIQRKLLSTSSSVYAKASYNRSAAVSYATTYTSTSTGTSSYNPLYRNFSVDCANYVSQCLRAGGFVNRGSSYTSCSSWYYNTQGTTYTTDDNNSVTWSTANGLKRYLYDCGGFSTVLYQNDLWYGTNVALGDPFFSDWSYPVSGEAPYYEHSMIITQIVGSDVRYSGHTSNRRNRTLHHSTTPYDFWFTDAWTRGFHITSLNGFLS